MNIRPCLLLFTWIIGSGLVSAQTKIRMRVLDENDRPLKFLRLTLTGANLPVETESNGELTLEFPPGKAELVFYPPAEFERISPPNGALVLPEDKSRTIDIWLARKGSDNRELQTFTRVLNKKEQEKARLQVENEALKSRLTKLETARQSSRAERDSLETALRQNTGLTVSLNREIGDLRETVELKQQLFYQKIAGELIVYADRLKDLRDALPRIGDAFIDQRSMARFDKTIGAYNVARDSLLQNHRGYVEIVRALWGASPADTLATVYEQALTTVHQKTVLPLNTTLLDQFRAVRAEEVRPAKARKNTRAAADMAFGQLNTVIPPLETNIRAALTTLETALHQNH